MATISEISDMLQGGRDVDLPNGKRVTAQETEVVGNALRINVVVSCDGAVLSFDNPWIVVNPPTETDGGLTDAESVFDELVGGSSFFNA